MKIDCPPPKQAGPIARVYKSPIPLVLVLFGDLTGSILLAKSLQTMTARVVSVLSMQGLATALFWRMYDSPRPTRHGSAQQDSSCSATPRIEFIPRDAAHASSSSTHEERPAAHAIDWESKARDAWQEQAEMWSQLGNLGLDKHRDLVTGPTFMQMLPDVAGKRGVDIGCGSGYLTQKVAASGAEVIGIDIVSDFIKLAERNNSHHSVKYLTASALSLPFDDESMDFAVSFMALMDMPSADQTLREASRVLRPDGYFQFSILHPAYVQNTKWEIDDEGRPAARILGGYFDTAQPSRSMWMFYKAPEAITEGRDFDYPSFRKTMEEWFSMISDAGLSVEALKEPHASPELAEVNPEVYNCSQYPCFLILRCRKQPTEGIEGS